MTFTSRCSLVLWLVVVAFGAAIGEARQAASLSGRGLVDALRQGGYVLVMRHASAPAALPTAATAHAGNARLERQLSEAGTRGATEMGRAVRALGVPIGRVWSSPTFRARQTAVALALGTADVVESLGEGDASMQDPTPGLVRALVAHASEAPARGTNTVLITHSPNVGGAFPDQKPGLAEGEVVVTRPDGRGGTAVVGRIKIDEWPALASGR